MDNELINMVSFLQNFKKSIINQFDGGICSGGIILLPFRDSSLFQFNLTLGIKGYENETNYGLNISYTYNKENQNKVMLFVEICNGFGEIYYELYNDIIDLNNEELATQKIKKALKISPKLLLEKKQAIIDILKNEYPLKNKGT